MSTGTKDSSARKNATMRTTTKLRILLHELFDMGGDLVLIALMLWMLWYVASVQ
jgi:hypothetical protein